MPPLFKTTSYKTGAAWAVGATAFWKLLSFANGVLVALYFGANAATDVYFYLLMIIGFGVTFMQRLNTTVLIPEAMFLAEQDEPASRRFITLGFYFYVLLALVLCVAGLLFPVQIVHAFSRFDFALLQNAQALLCVAFFLFACNLVSYYLTAVAEMYKFFTVSILGPLNALCPLVFLLAFGKQWGIISMIYGFFIAGIIQILALVWLLKTKLHWNFTPQPCHIHTRAQKNLLSGQVLGIMSIINSLLPMYLLSGMGAGIVSALNYCRQITDSPTEIITHRVINVSKIELTENAARGQINVFNKNYLSTHHLLLFVLTPMAVFISYFAGDVVGLLFEHGRFTAINAAETAAFLRPFVFMLVLLVPAGLQSNTVAAWLKLKESLPYALVPALLFTAAVLWLLPKWGAFSYPYLAMGELVFGFILNYFLFRKHFPFINYFRSFWELLRLLAINVIALVPAALVKMLLGESNHFLNLLFCGSVYMTVLLLISYRSRDLQLFLKASELDRLLQKLF